MSVDELKKATVEAEIRKWKYRDTKITPVLKTKIDPKLKLRV